VHLSQPSQCVSDECTSITLGTLQLEFSFTTGVLSSESANRGSMSACISESSYLLCYWTNNVPGLVGS
jgi:hypothetical protein